MLEDAQITYPPLNTLKPGARNIWIVDGPAIRFGWPWPKFRFSTRQWFDSPPASPASASPVQLTTQNRFQVVGGRPMHHSTR